jgi:glycosyltransferase involved in cell wall biosynthesis
VTVVCAIFVSVTGSWLVADDPRLAMTDLDALELCLLALMHMPSRPLRILMIAPTPFFAHRGCHVRILEEIRALRAIGHEVVLCTYGLGEDVPGVDTVRGLPTPWVRKLSAGPSWHKLYLDVLLILATFRSTRSFRPDVVHAHLHEGVAAALPVSRWLGVPILADFQGSLTNELADHGLFDRWRWGKASVARIERWLNRLPEEVVVSAPPLAKDVRDDRHDDAVSLVPDGVDMQTFRLDLGARERMRDRFGFSHDDVVVAFLGLLTTYQGIDLLLESAVEVTAQVGVVKFLIMGFPGETAYQARAQALGLGDRVRFTGRIDYADSPAHLAGADLAVAPKLSPTEGNQKILNYMAIGLPTVAFDTPVNRAMLGDLGVYAPYGDRAGLTRGLVRLASDPDLRKRLGHALRRRAAEQPSWSGGALALGSLYERLVVKRQSPDRGTPPPRAEDASA